MKWKIKESNILVCLWRKFLLLILAIQRLGLKLKCWLLDVVTAFGSTIYGRVLVYELSKALLAYF